MISPLRYMGSKRSLAPTIAGIISQEHPNATVVDAFAGTCAIGTAVVGAHRVIANDIHSFAEVIARTLLVTTERTPLPSEAWKDLDPHCNQNLEQLRPAIKDRLKEEDELLRRCASGRFWKPFVAFNEEDLERPVPQDFAALPALAVYRQDPATCPYRLFTSYFAGAYFGLRQAAEVDSLRFAIDQAPAQRRDIYLFALLYAASHCSASPGHFAQYLMPRDQSTSRYIARLRRRSIRQYFEQALIGFTRPASFDRKANLVYRMDASEFLGLLGRSKRKSGLVIYADPPYSRAQYSRYYHALETLVLYDYPAADGKGRYREDRFQTDFSRKAKAADAMDGFVAAAAENSAPLFLSYPKNGLVYQAGGDVLAILKRHYRRARIVASVDLNHSTMGAAPGSAAIQVMEDVYYGEP